MTVAWRGKDLADAIEAFAPGSVTDHNETDAWVSPSALVEVGGGLRDRPEFRFDLLSSLTAVDYIDHFEVVYHLTSLPRNMKAVLKVKCGYGREDPALPSVTGIWRGAELQEREAWDLMGIRFEGHPNHKRIMLWEGFPGHPLRKDYVTYSQSVIDLEEQPEG